MIHNDLTVLIDNYLIPYSAFSHYMIQLWGAVGGTQFGSTPRVQNATTKPWNGVQNATHLSFWHFWDHKMAWGYPMQLLSLIVSLLVKQLLTVSQKCWLENLQETPIIWWLKQGFRVDGPTNQPSDCRKSIHNKGDAQSLSGRPDQRIVAFCTSNHRQSLSFQPWLLLMITLMIIND